MPQVQVGSTTVTLNDNQAQQLTGLLSKAALDGNDKTVAISILNSTNRVQDADAIAEAVYNKFADAMDKAEFLGQTVKITRELAIQHAGNLADQHGHNVAASDDIQSLQKINSIFEKNSANASNVTKQTVDKWNKICQDCQMQMMNFDDF